MYISLETRFLIEHIHYFVRTEAAFKMRSYEKILFSASISQIPKGILAVETARKKKN